MHHYAFDHYAAWRDDLGALPLLQTPGAFGENISTRGLTEADVCLGDRFALGDALLEISQGRQPCWKLNLKFDRPDMACLVQKTGRTGWYYRVLKSGRIEPGSTLDLVERPHPHWTIARLNAVIASRSLAHDELSEMAALSVLAESWRNLARRRLESRQVESWSKRLGQNAES